MSVGLSVIIISSITMEVYLEKESSTCMVRQAIRIIYMHVKAGNLHQVKKVLEKSL